MRDLSTTGRNHKGHLYNTANIDMVGITALLEAGHLPLETWDYLDEKFTTPVQKMDANYESLLMASTFDSLWDEVPRPYKPHDLSVWNIKDRQRSKENNCRR